MAFKILLALYLVVAVAMIFFILMQRGAGAQAGSGFGAGASGTVFGASGAGNFLTLSTKWLAIGFFGISIGMGVYVSHTSARGPATDLGVMAEGLPADQPAGASEVPAAVPANPEVPASEVPEATDASVPATDAAAPAAAAPAAAVVAPVVEPETAVEKSDKP
jgi:preprotein translocase subunit SecG